MPTSGRKDSGINSILDPIRAPAARDASVPLAPSARANAADGGGVRPSLPNIDALPVENPPRRRSSIMASGFTGQEVPRIGKVSEAKDPQVVVPFWPYLQI